MEVFTVCAGTHAFRAARLGLIALSLLPLAAETRPAGPRFELTDSTGARIDSQDYRGRVVVLNFWATWCGGCQVEIPWLMELQSQYRDRGLAVIGVSMDEDGWASVRPYLRKKPISYPIAISTEALAAACGAEALPRTLIIDRNGRIAATHTGLPAKDVLVNEIRRLLDE